MKYLARAAVKEKPGPEKSEVSTTLRVSKGAPKSTSPMLDMSDPRMPSMFLQLIAGRQVVDADGTTGIKIVTVSFVLPHGMGEDRHMVAAEILRHSRHLGGPDYYPSNNDDRVLGKFTTSNDGNVSMQGVFSDFYDAAAAAVRADRAKIPQAALEDFERKHAGRRGALSALGAHVAKVLAAPEHSGRDAWVTDLSSQFIQETKVFKAGGILETIDPDGKFGDMRKVAVPGSPQDHFMGKWLEQLNAALKSGSLNFFGFQLDASPSVAACAAAPPSRDFLDNSLVQTTPTLSYSDVPATPSRDGIAPISIRQAEYEASGNSSGSQSAPASTGTEGSGSWSSTSQGSSSKDGQVNSCPKCHQPMTAGHSCGSAPHS